MAFIGDFSQQNVRLNFQRQTKKKIFDVSISAGIFAIKFLNSGICRNWKEAFLFLNTESLIRIQALKYRRFYCETHVSVGERGAKTGVQAFLDNQRMAHPKIRCMFAPPPQPSSPPFASDVFANQYFKRHYA